MTVRNCARFLKKRLEVGIPFLCGFQFCIGAFQVNTLVSSSFKKERLANEAQGAIRLLQE